jgi:hypothetical protein
LAGVEHRLERPGFERPTEGQPVQFEVIQEIQGWDVVMWAELGRERVLAVITREALEDDADPPQTNLTAPQLLRLADRNKDVLSRVATAKFDAGEAFQPKPGALRRVVVRTGDLAHAGVKLSTSVLASDMHWADSSTGSWR